MAHGAQNTGEMGEKCFILMQSADVEKPYQRFLVGQAGCQSRAHACIINEARGLHEELYLGMYEGFCVVVAQGCPCHGEEPFKADDLRWPDDQRGGVDDGGNKQKAGVKSIGQIVLRRMF